MSPNVLRDYDYVDVQLVPCSACGRLLTLGIDAHWRWAGDDKPCEWRCPEHCENRPCGARTVEVVVP